MLSPEHEAESERRNAGFMVENVFTEPLRKWIDGRGWQRDGIRDVERSRGLGDVYKRQTFKILSAAMRRFSPSLAPAVKDISHAK